jgi:hypothetical protein
MIAQKIVQIDDFIKIHEQAEKAILNWNMRHDEEHHIKLRTDLVKDHGKVYFIIKGIYEF